MKAANRYDPHPPGLFTAWLISAVLVIAAPAASIALPVAGHHAGAPTPHADFLSSFSFDAGGSTGHDFSAPLSGAWPAMPPLQPRIQIRVNRKRAIVLRENFPNPFNPSTTISFEIRRSAPVRLAIYSSTGRHLITLLEGHLDAGTYFATWDGRDKNGTAVVSGTYFVQLQAAGEQQSRRITLVK